MSLGVSRTTNPIRFDTGIGKADYAEVMSDPAAGSAQRPLLPGSTTVSQALDEIFPTGRDVGGEIQRALVADNSTSLRTSAGFNQTARDTLAALRNGGTEAASLAADEIDALLADTDLFEHYRMALLET
ncbi:MAG: hypothetical protein K6F50_10145 [Kiritimatiellae bacterium]|nr:hypothetical protein [Kiritimatiellia bacterium]